MCRLQGYVTADVADAEGLHRLNLSGTKFRQLLRCVQIYLCNGGVCYGQLTPRCALLAPERRPCMQFLPGINEDNAD